MQSLPKLPKSKIYQKTGFTLANLDVNDPQFDSATGCSAVINALPTPLHSYPFTIQTNFDANGVLRCLTTVQFVTHGTLLRTIYQWTGRTFQIYNLSLHNFPPGPDQNNASATDTPTHPTLQTTSPVPNSSESVPDFCQLLQPPSIRSDGTMATSKDHKKRSFLRRRHQNSKNSIPYTLRRLKKIRV